MEKFKYVAKNNLSKLPKTSGVYSFLDKNKILYIGKAINIKERVKNHFSQPKSLWEQALLRQGFEGRIGLIKTQSEIEALILEAKLIKKFQPRFNIVWRDDKNYFYVEETKEKFPRILINHQTKNLKSDFAGPFVDGKSLKETLKVLRKVFPFRSCRILPKKSCLWYHLDRCPAPCLLNSKIMEVPKIRQKLQQEAKKNARLIMQILEGKKNKVLSELKKEMRATAKKQDFERAQKTRDKISSLERVLLNAKVLGSQNNLSSFWGKTQKTLQKITRSDKIISRIEAFDISNIQGKEATGSMVTFINGLPDKNLYRKFKVKITGKPDDVAMMKEILSRRFKHLEWGVPDLILVDGGKAQLNAAKLTINNYKLKIPLLALAKKKNELYVEERKKPILLNSLPREIFNLILQLRDEAHRFALSYHKKLRKLDLLGKV